MPSITVGPLSNFSSLLYNNAVAGTYAVALAQNIANTINANVNGANPTLTQVLFPAGLHSVNGTAVAGEPGSGINGIAAFQGQTNPASVFVNGADQYIVAAPSNGANPGAESIQGGAAGGFFIGGAGVAGAARNITYTNITPTGTATDQIAILGGNNLIQTANFGTGNYNVQTGDGNDTINILLGNATINAGTGFNQINLGTGNSFIGSEGNDTITGAPFGAAGGVDTVSIGSGATSINSGGSSFLVQDASPNQLFVTLGSGVDTIQVGGSGGASIGGIYTSTSIFGGTVAGGDTSTGDNVVITGSGVATVTARGANDTVNAASSNGANSISAGTGNDTLLAGLGADTLSGARIGGSAFLGSGAGRGTTFQFTSGQGGGSDTIVGLKATDILQFNGLGTAGSGQIIPGSATTGVVAGGTTYSLADGTTLTILGTQPTAAQVQVR